MPVAIEIPYDETDQIYGRDLRFDDITRAGVAFGDAKHFKHQVTLVNTACTDVPQFVGNALEQIGVPGKHYVVDRLSAGLEIGADGREVGVVTRHTEKALPCLRDRIVRHSPTAANGGVVHGQSDTDLQAAVNEHRVLYFPMGNYRANAPLVLKPDTVLIGLHSTRTTLGSIVTPKNGTNLVSGLGFGPLAPRPIFSGWRAKNRWQMILLSRQRRRPRTPRRPCTGRWRRPRGPAGGEAQPYMVVRDGGGGIFRNVWIEGGTPPTVCALKTPPTRGRSSSSSTNTTSL